MTDKTAFEKWWLDEHGPNWSEGYSAWEMRRCEKVWNAAIDAAHGALVENAFRFSSCAELAIDQCVEEIQKLRSE